MALYKLSPKAEEDLNRIWLRGVRDFGEVQADQYYYHFIVRFEQVAQSPKFSLQLMTFAKVIDAPFAVSIAFIIAL